MGFARGGRVGTSARGARVARRLLSWRAGESPRPRPSRASSDAGRSPLQTLGAHPWRAVAGGAGVPERPKASKAQTTPWAGSDACYERLYCEATLQLLVGTVERASQPVAMIGTDVPAYSDRVQLMISTTSHAVARVTRMLACRGPGAAGKPAPLLAWRLPANLSVCLPPFFRAQFPARPAPGAHWVLMAAAVHLVAQQAYLAATPHGISARRVAS
jgi:hypothetical protein